MKNLKWLIGFWLKRKKTKGDYYNERVTRELNLARTEISNLKAELHAAKNSGNWWRDQLNDSESQLTQLQYNYKMLNIEFKNWKAINEQSNQARGWHE